MPGADRATVAGRIGAFGGAVLQTLAEARPGIVADLHGKAALIIRAVTNLCFRTYQRHRRPFRHDRRDLRPPMVRRPRPGEPMRPAWRERARATPSPA